MVKGVAYTVIFAAVAIGGPNILGSNKNSPYAFTRHQMGPHEVEPAEMPNGEEDDHGSSSSS
jgi:hypothetical protein